jgi:glutamine synthetase
MQREELIFVGTCYIAGHVRGKGFPARELAARKKQGIGWTHSNLMQNAFGVILDTPFGTGGDLMVVPDMSAEARVDFDDGSAAEHFFLGDIRNTDGSAWECCPREFLRRAIAALDAASGLHLIAAFEQEFVYTGVGNGPAMLTASSPGGGRASSAKASSPRSAPPGSSLTPSCPNMARANTS